MKSFFLLLTSASLFFLLLTCTEPIVVGSDLLEDDRATLGQTTDVPFVTNVVRDDSIQTFEGSDIQIVNRYSIGQIEDDYFGRTTQGAYYIPVVPRSIRTGLPEPPQFSFRPDRGADSIVLILPLDTSVAAYGPGRELPFRLNLLAGRVDIEEGTEYTTAVDLPNGFFDVNATDQISVSVFPRPLYDTAYGTVDTLPHLRVRLNDTYLETFNSRTSESFDSEEAFAGLLPGVLLEPTGDSDGLFGLLAEQAGPNTNPIANFYVFYQDTTANRNERIYRIPVRATLPAFSKDYNGSTVGELLLDGTDLEQVAIQGQGGVMTAITFTNLSELRDKVINQAEITFFRAEPDNYDYGTYPAAQRLALYYRNQRGNLTPIADQLFLRNGAVTDIRDLFLGGTVQRDENNNAFYRNRFSVHLQEMVEGQVPPTIFLRVVPVDEDPNRINIALNPSRVILNGPGAAELPASIRVTFTEVN